MSEQEFQKAFSDSEFVEKLLGLETGEQVRRALAEKGIVLTPEELDKFAEVLLLALEKNGKISDSELNEVSGGKGERLEAIKKGAALFAERVYKRPKNFKDAVTPAVVRDGYVPKWAREMPVENL